MALIQKIRSKSVLVITLMALAIAAFIGMLFTQDSNRTWGQLTNTSTIGKVDGQTLDYRELENRAQTLYQQRASDLNVRNGLFNQFVESTVVNKEAAALGLGISKDELRDLQFGKDLSPIVMSNPAFMDQNTRQVDPAQLEKIKQAVDANTVPIEGKKYLKEIEDQVISERLQAKILNLATKAVYTPTWLTEAVQAQISAPTTFAFTRIPFDKVEDKDVNVTDADLEKYISENKARYTNEEETRTLQYVQIDVKPSLEDSMKTFAKMEKLRDEFAKTNKDSSFVAANNGQMVGKYLGKEELPPVNRDTFAKISVGTVVGPYMDGKFVVLTKLLDRKTSPDSVHSRHILLQGANAQKTADSLKLLLDSGLAKWDSLNANFNTDPGAKSKNGDLGTQGQGMFVSEFNDLIFFKAQTGKTYTVKSQFGVHVVQVLGVVAGKNEARVKIAFIRELLIPSAETDKKASTAADDLITSSKNLDELVKNAQAKGFVAQTSPATRANDMYLGALGQATGIREILRWAFDSKVGERAKKSYALSDAGEAYPNKYIVPALKLISPKGQQTLADLRDQILPVVKNKKKGEVLKSKIGSADLASVAAQYQTRIDTARNVIFNAPFVSNLGNEPKFMGVALSTNVGSSTPAVVGESGVFVGQVLNKDVAANVNNNKEMMQKNMTNSAVQSLRSVIIKALRKNSSITDNRSKFF